MIEALLKTFFGALLGAGAMFLARKFGGFELSLESFGLGSGPIGELPVVTLPAIATLLSVFYELDNTDSPADAAKGARVAGKQPAAKLRAPASGGSARQADEDGEEAPVPARKAKK